MRIVKIELIFTKHYACLELDAIAWKTILLIPIILSSH